MKLLQMSTILFLHSYSHSLTYILLKAGKIQNFTCTYFVREYERRVKNKNMIEELFSKYNFSIDMGVL